VCASEINWTFLCKCCSCVNGGGGNDPHRAASLGNRSKRLGNTAIKHRCRRSTAFMYVPLQLQGHLVMMDITKNEKDGITGK